MPLVRNSAELVDLLVLVVTVSTVLATLSRSKANNLSVNDLIIGRNFLRREVNILV